MMGNQMKIICDPSNGHISYYLKNESGKWQPLSSDSPLSRKEYTCASFATDTKKILEKINSIYNRGNRGLSILFSGDTMSYEILKKAIDLDFSDKNLTCELGITKVAVLGKVKTGKTYLIKGIEKMQGCNYSISNDTEYTIYTDNVNHVIWYELKGIDLGLKNIDRAYASIKRLSKEGLSSVIYCIPASTGRMENAERELLLKINSTLPELSEVVSITMDIGGNNCQNLIDEIGKMTNQIKVIRTLAEKYDIADPQSKEQSITIEPYGLDMLSKHIFERR